MLIWDGFRWIEATKRPLKDVNLGETSSYKISPMRWKKKPVANIDYAIIRTFLGFYNLKEKTIVPFCTSGGSGISGIMKGIKASAEVGKSGKRRDLTDSSAKGVKNWAKKKVK